MWTSKTETLSGSRGMRVVLDHDSAQATYAEVLTGWRDDANFREQFNDLLANSPYTAFRWETPGITSRTLSQPFEFVLLDSPGLDRKVEPQAFAEHFTKSDSTVVAFANLSGDAMMIVPRPITVETAYGHLAAFCRNAPKAQLHGLWKLVAERMQDRISAKPVWLSTAGAGVSWLHVRLDSRPKYYGYAPYR